MDPNAPPPPYSPEGAPPYPPQPPGHSPQTKGTYPPAYPQQQPYQQPQQKYPHQQPLQYPGQQQFAGQPYGVGPSGVVITAGPGMYQGAPQQVVGTTVVVNVGQANFGPQPQPCFCNNCQEQVISSCEFESSSCTWVICFVIFFLGCLFFIPFFFCWIPFCMDDTKNVIHRCPKCLQYLGTYTRNVPMRRYSYW